MNYYTVYDNKTDEIVCHGNSKQVADFLGIKFDSLYYAITRQNNGRSKNPRYSIVIDYPGESESESE